MTCNWNPIEILKCMAYSWNSLECMTCNWNPRMLWRTTEIGIGYGNLWRTAGPIKSYGVH